MNICQVKLIAEVGLFPPRSVGLLAQGGEAVWVLICSWRTSLSTPFLFFFFCLLSLSFFFFISPLFPALYPNSYPLWQWYIPSTRGTRQRVAGRWAKIFQPLFSVGMKHYWNSLLRLKYWSLFLLPLAGGGGRGELGLFSLEDYV